MIPEGFRWWRSYQEMQEVEEIEVAKFLSSRCSGCPGIPRQSFARVRQDLVEVVLVDLGHGRSSELVREVRIEEGNFPAQKGEEGEVWSYRERRSSPVTVADSATSVLRSLVARKSESGRGWMRRAAASYRRGAGTKRAGINQD
jgi:hypothetical protein